MKIASRSPSYPDSTPPRPAGGGRGTTRAEPLIGPPGCNYPESSDGRPMAETHEVQYRMDRHDPGGARRRCSATTPTSYVVGDLMWYPVEEKNTEACWRPTRWSSSAGPRRGPRRGSYTAARGRWRGPAPGRLRDLVAPANNAAA